MSDKEQKYTIWGLLTYIFNFIISIFRKKQEENKIEVVQQQIQNQQIENHVNSEFNQINQSQVNSEQQTQGQTLDETINNLNNKF